MRVILKKDYLQIDIRTNNYKEMKIAIANDHAGTELKMELKSFLENFGYELVNFGTDNDDQELSNFFFYLALP